MASRRSCGLLTHIKPFISFMYSFTLLPIITFQYTHASVANRSVRTDSWVKYLGCHFLIFPWAHSSWHLLYNSNKTKNHVPKHTSFSIIVEILHPLHVINKHYWKMAVQVDRHWDPRSSGKWWETTNSGVSHHLPPGCFPWLHSHTPYCVCN